MADIHVVDFQHFECIHQTIMLQANLHRTGICYLSITIHLDCNYYPQLNYGQENSILFYSFLLFSILFFSIIYSCSKIPFYSVLLFSDLSIDGSTVCKKRNLTVRKLQNIFSQLRGVNSFWHYCTMVGVLHHVLWLEDDMLSRLLFI